MSNSPTDLTHSDYAVLDSLRNAPHAVSQRELARRTGLSVGLINAVIKKLVHTGYVRTSQLNRRSLEYLLTPQGFSSAASRSYHYIADTVHRYQIIQARLKDIVAALVKDGYTDFYLHGDGEIAELVNIVISAQGICKLNRGLPEGKNGNTVVLNTMPASLEEKGFKAVNLMGFLTDNGNSAGAAGSQTKNEDEVKLSLQFTK